MKIDHLFVKDFIGLEAADMDLSDAPVHMVVGSNAAGKTSVLDAMAFAFTGKCRGMKRKNEAKMLAHGFTLQSAGSKKSKVQLRANGFEWSRGASAKASVKEAVLAEQFGGAGLLEAVFSGFRFLDMSLESRLALVKELSGDDSAIQAAVQKAVAEAGLEAQSALFKGYGVDIDGMEELAKSGRINAKNKLAELDRIEPKGEVEVDGTVYDIRGHELAEYDEKVRELSGAKLLAPAADIKGKIEERDRELFALEAVGPKEVSAALDAKQRASAELKAVEGQGAEARGRKQVLTEQYKAVEGLGEKCPTCGQGVSEAVLADLRDGVVKKGNKAAAELETCAQRLGALKGEAQAAAEKHKSFQTQSDRRNELQMELSALKADLAESETSGDVVARLAIGRKLRDAREQYDKDRAELAKRPKIEKEKGQWNELALALRKDGDIRKVAAEGFDISAAKQAVDIMCEGRKVTFEPDGSVTLDGRPEWLFSPSERCRVGAGFSAAISLASGVGVLLLDGADILAGEAKDAFIGWISSIQEKFQTVMISATLTSGAPPAETPDWLQVWEVSGKTVRKV